MNQQNSKKTGFYKKNKPNNLNTSLTAIRKGYEEYSVQGFYEQFGDDYQNPQELAVQQILQLAVSKWNLNLEKILDLACGSGEVTLTLKNLGCSNIDGIDPYTYNAYLKRTGTKAETYTFEDITNGIISDRCYSLIICSFALHLLPESRLPILLYQLNMITNSLIIITPHKRPNLKSEWGWNLLDEIMLNRVRARIYQSSYDQQKKDLSS